MRKLEPEIVAVAGEPAVAPVSVSAVMAFNEGVVAKP